MEDLTEAPSNRSHACLLTHARPYQAGYLLVMLLFWLTPFFVTGVTGRPWKMFPRVLSHQHNSAALFTRYAGQWNDRHLEWKRADGSWFELDERRLFPKGIYGDESRMDRMLRKHARGTDGRYLALRLVRYGWERGAAAGLLGDDVVGARLVRTHVLTGAPDVAHLAGAWKAGKAADYPESHRRVLYRFTVEQGRVSFASVPPAKPNAPAAKGPAEARRQPPAPPPTATPPTPAMGGTPPIRRLLIPENKSNPGGGEKANP